MFPIQIDLAGTVEGFQQILQQTISQKDVAGVLVLACDANDFKPEAVNTILKNIPIPIFGGVFPEIIHGRNKLIRGTILVGLSTRPNVQIIPHLSDPSIDYEEIIAQKFPASGQNKTMFVLVDGFSQRINALIDSLFNYFGLEVNYLGGGCGSLSFVQKPCLFTNEGLIEDSAVLATVDIASGIGVSHGWYSVSGPFKVTEADRNVILTIDWQPAFSIYRRVVEEAAHCEFTDTNFFELAKSYPFGIKRLCGDMIVRDPIMVKENGALVCVGEVPAESYVDILTGDTSSLVKAAGKALTLSLEAFHGPAGRTIIILIDCISRVLFLGKEFEKEIQAVYQEDIPLIGALTLGEIANSGRDYLEFYNKTAVVGYMEAK
jgi:hypothetical protein